MTDKIIINTISKIHFTIISFFIFVFFFLSTLFILIQDGVAINKINLLHLKIEQLYIKWDKKLVITAKNISVDTTNKNKDNSFDIKKVQSTFHKIDFFLEFVEEITFSNIEYDDIFMNFTYSTKNGGKFYALSEEFELNSTFYYDSDSLHFLLHNLKYKSVNIYGEMALFAEDKDATATLFLEAEDGNILDINLKSNPDYLDYNIISHNHINNVKSLLAIVDFPAEVKYWVDDAISLKSFELQELYGTISYDDPSQSYKEIYAKAIAHNLSYLYNPALNPVDTELTNLEFKDGVLYIRPEKPSSYGFDLKNSWLKINFTKPQELLTLFLVFDGSLSKDVVHILNTYHIPVPFLQKKGIAEADLKIEVNLRTIAIDALGKFQTENANFDFFDFNFDVKKANILLHNYDLSIDAKDASHKNMLLTDVNTKIDVKNIKGDINFFFKEVTDSRNSISLTKKQPFKAIYSLSKGDDSLWLSPSSWEFAGTDFNISETNLKINFENLSTKFDKIKIKLPNMSYFELSGEGSLKDKSLKSNLNLFNISFDEITSPQSYIPMLLSYTDETLLLTTRKDTYLNYQDKNIWIDKIGITLKNNILNLPETSINLDDFLEFRLSADYNLDKNKGNIKTNKVLVRDDNKSPLLKIDNSLNFELEIKNNIFLATQKELDLSTRLTKDSWHVDIKNLENIYPYSVFLQDYNLTNGFLNMSRKYIEPQIDFSLQTNYPYKLLHDNNKHIDNYKITGNYTAKNNTAKIDINKKISLEFDKNISLHAKNIGIDIFTLFDFIENITPKKESDNKIDILFNAENSYLYLTQKRRIISDLMELKYNKEGIDASLIHQNAKAYLTYDNKKQFLLYGQEFSDQFLEQLFSYSKFKDANLAFTLNGSINDFDGVLYLKDSTIKDYKIINNILAFVNTVPSLVTFSLPGYSSKGLFVTNSYMKFHSKDFLFDLSDILIETKELTILGKGQIDYKKDIVDLKLNLKTDLGSSVSQIPIIGYILFDKKNITTSISVKGTLENPEVSSLLAQEIIVAPFSIIKRTLLLPYHLLSDDKD